LAFFNDTVVPIGSAAPLIVNFQIQSFPDFCTPSGQCHFYQDSACVDHSISRGFAYLKIKSVAIFKVQYLPSESGPNEPIFFIDDIGLHVSKIDLISSEPESALASISPLLPCNGVPDVNDVLVELNIFHGIAAIHIRPPKVSLQFQRIILSAIVTATDIYNSTSSGFSVLSSPAFDFCAEALFQISFNASSCSFHAHNQHYSFADNWFRAAQRRFFLLVVGSVTDGAFFMSTCIRPLANGFSDNDPLCPVFSAGSTAPQLCPCAYGAPIFTTLFPFLLFACTAIVDLWHHVRDLALVGILIFAASSAMQALPGLLVSGCCHKKCASSSHRCTVVSSGMPGMSLCTRQLETSSAHSCDNYIQLLRCACQGHFTKYAAHLTASAASSTALRCVNLSEEMPPSVFKHSTTSTRINPRAFFILESPSVASMLIASLLLFPITTAQTCANQISLQEARSVLAAASLPSQGLVFFAGGYFGYSCIGMEPAYVFASCVDYLCAAVIWCVAACRWCCVRVWRVALTHAH
jgi:hypothetical protein